MGEIELKPCPFCGGEGAFAKPGCKGSLFGAGCWGPGHIAYGVGETREEAAAVWNTRQAAAGPHTDLIARLQNAGIDASDDWVIMQAAADALKAATPSERERRLERAIDSLTAWLLHRFGPDTPEGREATVACTALAEQGEKK